MEEIELDRWCIFEKEFAYEAGEDGFGETRWRPIVRTKDGS